MNIAIRNLNKSYGNEEIFKNFNIEFNDEYINCIIGKSGCGKSTLLNIIAGLIEIQSGEVNGVSVSDVSYIFQEDRLIEWLTVEENLEIALKKYFDSSIISSKIEEVLKLVGIYDVKNKYPNSLSGGMRQRINIARAFGKPSKVILMDEPFKSLDYKLKYSIIDEFKDLLSKEKRMVILVTHDLDEAIYFRGNIIVFRNKPVEIAGVFNNDLDKCKNEILKLIWVKFGSKYLIYAATINGQWSANVDFFWKLLDLEWPLLQYILKSINSFIPSKKLIFVTALGCTNNKEVN